MLMFIIVSALNITGAREQCYMCAQCIFSNNKMHLYDHLKQINFGLDIE